MKTIKHQRFIYMEARSTLGKKYVGLVLERAGMMDYKRAKEARLELDSLVKIADDSELEEAARNLARNAATGGSDYNSEYASSLNHLKNERTRLNSVKALFPLKIAQ